jgi:hypothetical protein
MEWIHLFISFLVYWWNDKITISNQSHKSYRKYKSDNGCTRTSEYISGGIRCHGVSISMEFPSENKCRETTALRVVHDAKFPSFLYLTDTPSTNKTNFLPYHFIFLRFVYMIYILWLLSILWRLSIASQIDGYLSAEDAYSFATPDSASAFVGGPCCPALEFEIALWIMITFYTLLTSLFYTKSTQTFHQWKSLKH